MAQRANARFWSYRSLNRSSRTSRSSIRRLARAALNLTVRELERRTGVKKNTISRYERGQQILVGAAKALEDLFREEGITFVLEDARHGPGIVLSKDLSLRLGQASEPKPKKGRAKKK